jgi:hypothetical protein
MRIGWLGHGDGIGMGCRPLGPRLRQWFRFLRLSPEHWRICDLLLDPGSSSATASAILGYEISPGSRADLFRITLPGPSGPYAATSDKLLDTMFDEQGGEVSPDGRLLAYHSDDSNDREIYVRPYPIGAPTPVTSNGGTFPVWTKNGRELVYLDGQGRITAVAVNTTATSVEVGPPTTLFTTAYRSGGWRPYDVSSDGTRFLVVKEGAPGPDGAAVPTIKLVEHWFEDLKRLVLAK